VGFFIRSLRYARSLPENNGTAFDSDSEWPSEVVCAGEAPRQVAGGSSTRFRGPRRNRARTPPTPSSGEETTTSAGKLINQTWRATPRSPAHHVSHDAARLQGQERKVSRTAGFCLEVAKDPIWPSPWTRACWSCQSSMRGLTESTQSTMAAISELPPSPYHTCPRPRSPGCYCCCAAFVHPPAALAQPADVCSPSDPRREAGAGPTKATRGANSFRTRAGYQIRPGQNRQFK
jgi:hypothetical protein